MAIIDKQNNLISIRIVYDGRSGAGKTTTIHGLRDALAVDKAVFSPDYSDNSTSYFDWLEYTGGQFEGMPVSCQILTTPGAEEFKSRREYLLRQADIVVFVVDSANLDEIMASYVQLQTMTAEINCNILLQANKQDLATQQHNAEIQQLFTPLVTKIIQTNALKNRGIREVFVTAVHLAVENLATHETNSTAIANPQQLLQLLQLLPTMPESSPEIPSLGADYTKVYPPLLGHDILQNFNHNDGANLRNEIWEIKLVDTWRALSKLDWLYNSETEAIQALRQHSSWQLRCSSLLMAQRCLSIHQQGQQWRLWQITALIPDIATQLKSALQNSDDVQHWATQLYIYSNGYLDGYHSLMRLGFELDLQPHNLAIDGSNVLYLGAIYALAHERAAANIEATLPILRQHILPLIQTALLSNQYSIEDCILALENLQPDDPSQTAQYLMESLLELA